MPEAIKVDVWSDIACPWCYIGKRNLEVGLTAYAGHGDAQLEMAERLFSAYFVEGRHIGRDEDLADLAVDVGLDRAGVLEALRTGAYEAAVAADKAAASDYGINGVPFFVIDGTYGLSGAQPAAAFEQVLAQVVAERAAAPQPI